MQNEYFRGAINPVDCISNGWNLVGQNFGLFFGVVLVGGILAGCIPCVSLFISGPIIAGIYYVMLRQMNGEQVEFGMMFKGFEVFVPAMVIGLIIAIPEIIGQGARVSINIADLGLTRDGANNGELILASGLAIFALIVGLVILVVGIIIRVSLFFALPLIIERNMAVGDAIKLSAGAAWSNFGGLFVLFILEVLVIIGGLLLCFVGVLFVAPIIYAANVFAYRQVFPKIDQNFQHMPPPPTAYGNFGQGM